VISPQGSNSTPVPFHIGVRVTSSIRHQPFTSTVYRPFITRLSTCRSHVAPLADRSASVAALRPPPQAGPTSRASFLGARTQ
jgi:hypothetical protein